MEPPKTNWLTLAPAVAAPALLLLAGLCPAAVWRNRPGGAATAARGAAWGALALAVVAAVGLPRGGTSGPWFYYDRLSALVQVLVAFLGAVVTAYSHRYLAGEAGRDRYTRWLGFTCVSALALPVAGNLLAFTLVWSAGSFGLHHLLIHYPERPGAQLAARKKFIVSRLGDLCLLGVLWLVHGQFGTWEFAELLHAPAARPAIGWLLAVAALLKCAQFPFHTWLPDTLEAPTPVSALMHAGFINAGGFLVLRLAPLAAPAPGALLLLAYVGALSAAFGTLVLAAQPARKRALAYSTIAQMGFMLLECGLGLPGMALLHLLAHALYKANAFLRAATLPEPKSLPRPVDPSWSVTPWLVAGALFLATARLAGLAAPRTPGEWLAGSLLLLALGRLLAASWSSGVARPIGAALVLLLAALGCGLQQWVTVFFADIPGWADLRAAAPAGPAAWFLAIGFPVVLLLIECQRQPGARRNWRRLQIHARNGWYCHTLANRSVKALWPVSPISPQP